MSYKYPKSSEPLYTKTNRNDRYKQMSKQQQLIEEKKRQIQIKLEEQKRREADEALKKLKTEEGSSDKSSDAQAKEEDVKPGLVNIFSNDGSFLDQFKKLSEMGGVPKSVPLNKSSLIISKSESDNPANGAQKEVDGGSTVTEKNVSDGTPVESVVDEGKRQGGVLPPPLSDPIKFLQPPPSLPPSTPFSQLSGPPPLPMPPMPLSSMVACLPPLSHAPPPPPPAPSQLHPHSIPPPLPINVQSIPPPRPLIPQSIPPPSLSVPPPPLHTPPPSAILAPPQPPFGVLAASFNNSVNFSQPPPQVVPPPLPPVKQQPQETDPPLNANPLPQPSFKGSQPITDSLISQVPADKIQGNSKEHLEFGSIKQEPSDLEDSKEWFQSQTCDVDVKDKVVVKEESEVQESKESAAARAERKRKSRWGDSSEKVKIPPVAVVPALPPVGSTPTIQVTGMSGHLISKVTRTDPGLLHYTMNAYGTNCLSEEDWKKAEDNYKVHLLYQDMLKKRAEVERLEERGKHKYEYDSDEETDGGTWEHRVREKEMLATKEWADTLTEMAKGKHHIGDFLPPDELKRFLDKYSAMKGGGEPDLSDYKEFKLTEDNKGFQMLQKLGWSEGQGLGSDGSGILDPINKAKTRDTNLGLGSIRPDDVSSTDDEYDAYRKRMMLAYRFRPNPLNNPRRPYY